MVRDKTRDGRRCDSNTVQEARGDKAINGARSKKGSRCVHAQLRIRPPLPRRSHPRFHLPSQHSLPLSTITSGDFTPTQNVEIFRNGCSGPLPLSPRQGTAPLNGGLNSAWTELNSVSWFLLCCPRHGQ